VRNGEGNFGNSDIKTACDGEGGRDTIWGRWVTMVTIQPSGSVCKLLRRFRTKNLNTGGTGDHRGDLGFFFAILWDRSGEDFFPVQYFSYCSMMK
jgi:hypothetical protein